MLNFTGRFAPSFAAAFCLLLTLLHAQPALTTIQDVLYKADGTRFSGVVQITWTSFQAGDATNIPMQTVTVDITNGYLHVLLAPTTNATPAAVYNVVYNSDGRIQFAETWVVPPSKSPLRVSSVRTSSSAGTVGGLSQVQITDVSGLQTELNLRPTIGAGFSPLRTAVIDINGGLAGATGNLSDCIHVDGSSGPCTSGGSSGSGSAFSDSETPSGAINGVNTTFQLTNAPNPASSVKIVRTGLVLQQNVDYTVSATAVTFQSGSVPQPGDVLEVSYRTAAVLNTSFADGEIPSGAVDGSNLVFTLANAPNPVNSLSLYRGGLAMRSGVDFSLSSAAVTFLGGSVPQPGDVLQAFYRTSQ